MQITPQFEHPVLCQSIWTLPLSESFKFVMALQGFETLSDVLKNTTWQNERLPGFNIQLVHEYVCFLESNGLGPMVDCY